MKGQTRSALVGFVLFHSVCADWRYRYPCLIESVWLPQALLGGLGGLPVLVLVTTTRATIPTEEWHSYLPRRRDRSQSPARRQSRGLSPAAVALGPPSPPPELL